MSCPCPIVEGMSLMKMESNMISHCSAISCIRQVADKKTAPQVAWTIERTCRLMNSIECPHYNDYKRLRDGR